MRHLKAGRQFGRNTAHRRAMLRNLTANLIAHERIETTDAKAKELRRVTERLISKAVRLGKVAYTKPPTVIPTDPAAAREVSLGRAKRLHVERLIRQSIPRFGTRIEGTEVKRVDLVEKVLLDLAKRFKDRPGGYTRITKIGRRRGDNAPMSLVELLGPLGAAEKIREEKPAQPKADEPKAAKPEAAKPEAAKPEAAEPKAGEPEATEPAAAKSKTAKAKTVEAETAEPKTAEPKAKAKGRSSSSSSPSGGKGSST